MTGRRRRPALGLSLLVLTLIELVVVIAVGRWIGAGPTTLLLLAISVLGALLVRREGLRAWRALRQSARSGRAPSREIADAVLVLIGGVLLVLPGFVGDVIGLFLVLPFTRPLARPLLEAAVARRVFGDLGTARVVRRRPRSNDDAPHDREVVEGEIVED